MVNEVEGQSFYDRQQELIDYLAELIQQLYKMNLEENRDFHGNMDMDFKPNKPGKCSWKLKIFTTRK